MVIRQGSRKYPKRTVSPAGYRSYIQSPDWRAQRLRYWQSGMPKCCYACGLPWDKFVQGMHLHHRAYWNLGDERLIDLQPLCEPCHLEVHQIVKSKQRGLWKAARHLKRRHLIHGLYHMASLDPRQKQKWTPEFREKMRRKYG